MKLEFSAGGLVYRRIAGEIKFALIQDTSDQWTFPKGHIEKGEKSAEAGARETEEEIGLKDLKVLDLLEKSDYWFKFNNELIHKFVYFYLMESAKGELVHQVEEIKDAQWFTPQEALEIVGYKKQNEALLRKAYQRLNLDVK